MGLGRGYDGRTYWRWRGRGGRRSATSHQLRRRRWRGRLLRLRRRLGEGLPGLRRLPRPLAACRTKRRVSGRHATVVALSLAFVDGSVANATFSSQDASFARGQFRRGYGGALWLHSRLNRGLLW